MILRHGHRSFGRLAGAIGVLACTAGCPLPGTLITTDFGNFTKKTILTQGLPPAPSFTQPAYLRFGPDGRLYVTTYTGSLFVITLDADKNAVDVQERAPFPGRLMTGLAFDPWASPADPVLYVINNDLPLYESADLSGRLSRLSGPGLGVGTNLVAGLPRSFENHMTFALLFGTDRRLYVAQGGNTNHGMPAPGLFGNRPERELSAAILAADVRNPAFKGMSDVEVYAPGMRNPYGLCLHSNGYMYVEDQGGNKGFGGRPGPDCESQIELPNLEDELNVLFPGRYYGHPNPARGQCEFQADLADGTPHEPPMMLFPMFTVVTAICEYDSPANDGLLLGQLLLTGFGEPDGLHRVSVSADGLSVTDYGILTVGFENPLDLTIGPDGSIFILEAGESLGHGGLGPTKLTVLEPVDPPLGKWSAKAVMSTARSEIAAAALNGQVYVIGGDTPGGVTASVQAYDPASNTWTGRAPVPGTPANHQAAAAVGGKLYVFGGLTQWPAPAIGDVWEYDPASDGWTARTPMPRARGAMGVAVYEGRVYLFGGLAEGNAVADVTIYDPASDTWEDLSASLPMPTPRDHFPAVTSRHGLIYCLGGRQVSIASVTGVVEAFDPLERRWITGYGSIPTPRAGHAGALLHGKIVVAGGEGAASLSGVFHSVEEYDPVSNTWRTLTAMPSGRHGTQAAVLNNVMYLAGGGALAGGNHSNTMWAFGFLP